MSPPTAAPPSWSRAPTPLPTFASGPCTSRPSVAPSTAVPRGTSGTTSPPSPAGPRHGYGVAHEACLQLGGEAGERQVAGPPEVAVAGAGGGPLGGCLLLTRG